MNWANIAKLILGNRIPILAALITLTAYMGYQAQYTKVSYGLPRLLPETDSTDIAYTKFKERYGDENLYVIIGIKKNPLKDLNLYNAWHELGNSLKKLEGVDTVLSITRIQKIVKDSKEKKFTLTSVIATPPRNYAELDSVREEILKWPFYEGILYNPKTDANLMALTINRKIFNSDKQEKFIAKVVAEAERFSSENDIKVYCSGLSYIRSSITRLIKKELKMFVLMSLAVTILILFFFFRSIKPVMVSMSVVACGVAWSLGTMVVLGYEISILTAIIPPLIIVIGVPNCIYLINKYHYDYRESGNKMLALIRVIQKVGKATFMTNATTAMGFVTFTFTDSAILKEFGVVTSINIMMLFLISIIVMPISFSYLNPPKEKYTKHLDRNFITRVVKYLISLVTYHRKAVYITTIVLVVAAFFGVSMIVTTGNIVDDLPNDHKIPADLRFFEEHFNGIMPFEITIDAKKPGFATKDHTLKKINKLQKLLREYDVLSKPVSLVDGIKFLKQGFYNGNPKKYALINRQEKIFFKPYLDKATGSKSWLNAFVDSTKQHTRISAQVADIGTIRMDSLIKDLKPKIDSIFNPAKYEVNLTGSSITFLAGTNYLVKNLFVSLVIAIFLIACIMALLFASFRMIAVSLITNLIPLLLTAAVMGFYDIHLKPSTILVFSIAFGISVDDTIHFLAKYRQELKVSGMNIKEAVLAALKETGVSMIYTSIILFFGFSVFMSSVFGGTMALGVLVSFTLLTAMLANLVLLPAFLLSMDKALTTKAFKSEPLLQIYDEEEDIELDDLEIRKIIE